MTTDEGKNFCSNHNLNESKICRSEKDIRTLSETMDNRCTKIDERLIGVDENDTIVHTKIFDRIESKVSIKVFGIFVSAILFIGMGVITWQNVQIKKGNEAQAATAQEFRETLTDMNDSISGEFTQMSRDMQNMALGLVGLKGDVAHLKKDLERHERLHIPLNGNGIVR